MVKLLYNKVSFDKINHKNAKQWLVWAPIPPIAAILVWAPDTGDHIEWSS